MPGLRLSVGEIATSTAADADLLANFGGVVKHQYAQTLLPCHRCAEQPGGTGTDNDEIERAGQASWCSAQTAE